MVSLLLVLLCGCGGAALDATNVDTFERTFKEMIADMREADREALAQAVLAVHADAIEERILPRSLPGKLEINALLDPSSRHAYAREIVGSAGTALDGKTNAQLLAMAEEIRARADDNQAVWEQAQREQRHARIRDEISDLEGQLAGLREDVQAAQAEKALVEKGFKDDFAILDGLNVSLNGQRQSLEKGWLRNEVDLTFTNGTNHVVRDAGFSYDWVYGECAGRASQHGKLRIFETPLEPNASASVIGHAGRGWLGRSIRDDSSDRSCTLTTAEEYGIMNVKTSSVSFGDPLQTIDRHRMEYELDRLDRRIDSRRERVASMQQRIEERRDALAER